MQLKQINLFSVIVTFSLLLFIITGCKKTNETVQNHSAVTSINSDNAVSSASLVAWYKFTNGNTADFSGYNNHVVFSNAVKAKDYLGKPNNAYLFDGIGSYMVVNNSSSLNPTNITIGALIKPLGYYNGPGATSRILMKGYDDQANGVYFLGFLNDGSYYGVYGDNQFNSAGITSVPNIVKINKWQKLVYTYNGITAKLYVNDVLVSQVNKTASFTPNIDPLNIGKTGRSDFPYWFHGVIDEIRIYNTALNQLQVKQVDEALGK